MSNLRERIWEAVLSSAMDDAAAGPSEQEIHDYIFCVKQDAEEWLASDENKPGTFCWVCDLLGLDPSAVRREVERRKSDG